MKKHCVAEFLLAIWGIFLHESNCNYNSYRFSYRFVFILFLSFLTNKKQESGFQQVGGLVTRNICFLFIASSAVLQSHAKFNRLFIKEFSYMLFTWNFLTWIFLQVFPSIWHFLYHWDYAKFSYLIWLTNWLTDLCTRGMENLDRIESDRTSNETDGAKNISNCNICWFELGIFIIYSCCLNNNLLQQFVMYINVK